MACTRDVVEEEAEAQTRTDLILLDQLALMDVASDLTLEDGMACLSGSGLKMRTMLQLVRVQPLSCPNVVDGEVEVEAAGTEAANVVVDPTGKTKNTLKGRTENEKLMTQRISRSCTTREACRLPSPIRTSCKKKAR